MQHYVMVVDDDEQSRFLMSQVLHSVGAEVLEAQNGHQAIELLNQHTPDIIFLDLLLPKVNGIEVLDYIIETPRLNTMQVVIVSAHDRFGSHPQLRRVDNYFVKPVQVKQIRDLAYVAVTRQAAS
jgi:CheY-like chemotaxis protein